MELPIAQPGESRRGVAAAGRTRLGPPTSPGTCVDDPSPPPLSEHHWSHGFKYPKAIGLSWKLPMKVKGNYLSKIPNVASEILSIILNLTSKKTTLLPLLWLLFVLFLAVFGPWIIRYDPEKTIYLSDGSLAKVLSPSYAHPLGTTYRAQDVLSRLITGARPSVMVGMLGGAMIVTIGTTVGLASGYIGGRVDDVLMRITDIVYSVPSIPFALVVVALLGMGFNMAIVTIGLILWRGPARVIRSQVLQIKGRPYVLAAKADGAGSIRIMVKYILPNVLPTAGLFFALGIGYSIILMAALAFLGVVNPFVPSWGVMLRNAYSSGYMANQPFWSIPPGLMIAMTVISTFLLSRELEDEGSNEQTDEMVIQGG